MFPLRGCVTGMLAIALWFSGCLGPLSDQDDFEENTAFLEPEQEIVVESKEFEATVSPGWLPLGGEQQLTPDWEFSLPEGTDRLTLRLEWRDAVNEYTLVLETPQGEERWELESDPMEDNQSWEGDLVEPGEGEYVAYVTAETVAQGDEFHLTSQWQYTIGGPLGASAESPVVFDQDSSAWRATLPYRATGEVTAPLKLDVDTFNGRIEVLSTDDDHATARVHPWGRAATQERAEELARSVKVQISISGSDLKVHASKGPDSDTQNRESVGASVQLLVPVEITGSVKSSNGRIVLEDMEMSDLQAKTSNGRIVADGTTSGDLSLLTSNGRIMADLEGSGDILLDTSNGRIELDLAPTGATQLNADTSNGRMTYRLQEGSDVGYRLDASTSNSKISNDMDEADWSGGEKQGTLETRGFSNRPIQVTGEVQSSNGAITFKGE